MDDQQYAEALAALRARFWDARGPIERKYARLIDPRRTDLDRLEAERFAEVEPILRDYDSEVARVTAEHNAWKDRLESEPKA